MQFKEIIKNNTWLNISEVFLSLYPDQVNNREVYKSIFIHLQEMDMEVCSIRILLEHSLDENSNFTSFIEVFGVDSESTFVALEFVPWRKWLGMSIEVKTLAHFKALEIIAHCLFEMTFVGFDENKIQEKFLKIKTMKDSLDKLTDKEKLRHTKSLDDLMQELSDE